MQNHASHLCEQKMLTDVWTKFRLFQKPANFDMRLAECERVLAGVKAQVGLLEVGSVEHDVVQSQLEQCMVGKTAASEGNVYSCNSCNSYAAPAQSATPARTTRGRCWGTMQRLDN